MNNEYFISHRAQGIGRDTARICDCRIHPAAAHAVTHCHVTHLVHGNAAHPAVIAVWRKGSLLEHRRCASRVPDLIPPHANVPRPGGHGMVHHQYVVTSKVSVGQTVHQTISHRVYQLRRPQLGNADSASAGLGERCHRNVHRPSEAGIAWRLEIDMKLPKVKRVRV